ncbi:peptidylprolyl isomerase [Pseudochryseolinea flava]|uniref:Peptidylprolyl isomerase n=1 Tax=Pseudochryseolinea flava TaxID=2059302 RepID=A0A364Y8Y2_9BACT|nr:peptidylprolyl isomerase [Pseudochryseolinea flava]RAW03566.1 peptidylprolyl isomerase [Pseudochryseolinea flava]
MKYIKAIRLAALITLVTVFKNVSAQENQGFVVDEIIAKVDNYIVLKSDQERAYQDYLTNGGTASQNAKCQYLVMLIRNKLMLAKAEIDSVVVADAEVDDDAANRMNMIISQSGRSVDELEQLYGKTMEQIRMEIREQVREQMIVRKMEGEITKDVKVTPAEVKRFFSKIDSLPYFSAAVEVAQIVKVASVSPQQENATKAELIDIRNKILAGEDFATLARKYSDDPSVVQNGGNMGWAGRGRMVPEYEAMAFKMKPNEISMPFKTSFGIHIMQLIERRGNEYNSRHILISPTPSEDDLNKATRYLDSLRNLIVLDSIKFQNAAKEYSDDVPTKGNGGFFTDGNGGTKLMVDELDPVVFFRIDSMKIGNISEPVVYRTEDGKDAVRILYYKSRTAPHEASLKDDWSRIQDAALRQKKDAIIQRWFQNARKDVFISIDPSFNYCGILDE